MCYLVNEVKQKEDFVDEYNMDSDFAWLWYESGIQDMREIKKLYFSRSQGY